MAVSGKQSETGLYIAILVIILAGSIFFFVSRPGPSPPPQGNPPDICPAGQQCPPATWATPSKETFTPAQQKLSTDLLRLTGVTGLPAGQTLAGLQDQMERDHQLSWVDESGRTTADRTTGRPLVYVYIQTSGTTADGLISAYLSNVTGVDPDNRLIVAWVETGNLTALASLDSVRSIRTVVPPVTWAKTR
jgi:hypothetical protein